MTQTLRTGEIAIAPLMRVRVHRSSLSRGTRPPTNGIAVALTVQMLQLLLLLLLLLLEMLLDVITRTLVQATRGTMAVG